ncbi:MAG: IS21 family transposase [Deltaproteobacteria bacterium]|nr:IS21 family transposase [Deltaproteobacteria bacterium]
MAIWTDRNDLVFQVIDLRHRGVSRRGIARKLGISRNTVGKIIREHHKSRAAPHDAFPKKPKHAPRPTKLDAHKRHVTELLEKYPEITAQRVFEELTAKGFEGGYTIVKEHVRTLRPSPPPTPSLPTPITGPGEMSESDWSPHRVLFTTGLSALVQVFSYVLRYSTRKYYSLFERCDSHALMDGLVGAFECFGGAAHVTKFDSQKPVVLGWEGSQPIYNPRFLGFATYHEFRPLACRPGKPNDKPRVERSFWEFEQSFLNGRSFRDLDDMRTQLRDWNINICDPRPHKKLKRPRLELFEEERPFLRPLPTHPFDTARVIYTLANIEGFVSWNGNRYAVPYDHVTEILPVRITQKELFVYAADLRLVAQHELAPKSAGLDLDPMNFHRSSRGRPAADLQQLEHAFAQMGQSAQTYFAALRSHDPRQCGYQARQILQLRGKYTTTDILLALDHARAFGALQHQAIARILSRRAAPRTLAAYVLEGTSRRFDNDPFVCPDDLDEYDRLPVTSSSTRKELPCPSEPPTMTKTPSLSDSDDTSRS